MNRWLPYSAAAGKPGPIRVLCFPPSGSGAAFFASLRRGLRADGLDLLPVQLPGRESRLDEESFTSVPAFVDAAVDGLAGVIAESPTVLFGHSMGAALAFEFAVELGRRGGPAPLAVVVSACRPGHVAATGPPLRDAPDAALIDMLRRLGGTPPMLLNSPEFLAMAVPILRADLTLCETYVPRGDEVVTVPLVALGAEEDDDVPVADLTGWARCTTAGFASLVVPGGHHYPQDGTHGLASVRAGIRTALKLTAGADG